AVFDADQTAFTVYHTQSGRLLRRAERPPTAENGRRQRWAVGRRLVELAADSTGSRLIVWDSRDNRVEFDIPLKDRLSCPLPNESDFAFVTSDGRLQILNVPDGRLVLDVPLVPATAESKNPGTASEADRLVVFNDRRQYYVNFYSDRDDAHAGSAAAEDQLAFPHVRVRGRLLAIDQGTQEIVWDRPVADACLPLRTDAQIPILVLVRQRRDESAQKARGSKEQAQRLMIEVLDADTGETLASRDDMCLAQFVDCTVTQPVGPGGGSRGTQLCLMGQQSCVDVTFIPHPGEERLRTAAEEGPAVQR
ncbi:MAG: hypothetical protein AB7Q45_03915, partial [Planctomycetaceae bacterium]